MSATRTASRLAIALAFAAQLLAAGPALAADAPMLPEIRATSVKQPFDAVVKRLEQSIKDNKMGLVAQASATRGAASIGATIPGNAVLMVFRPDYAVRMLEASVPAGIEAPLRIYVTENADGSTSVSYPLPSAVFKPYGDARLDEMARELDPIFDKIVRDATGG